MIAAVKLHYGLYNLKQEAVIDRMIFTSLQVYLYL